MATDLHPFRGRLSRPDARPDHGHRGPRDRPGCRGEGRRAGAGWLVWVAAWLWLLPLARAADNTAPTISALPDRTIDEDTSTGPIAFTVGDAESPAASLSLSRDSSNLTLVPLANIVFGGSGANRTVTVVPAANQSGTATITVTVSDGNLTASRSFLLTVTAVNDPPTLSSIANRTIDEDASTGAINFTVSDVDHPVASLTLSATSSNPVLVPTANIVFGGSGANRTVTVTPVPDENGFSDLTITVSDGDLTASRTFRLTVTPRPDDPEITGDVVSPIDDDYGTTGVALFADLTLADVDHNRPNSETLTVTVSIPDAYQALGSFRGSGASFSLSGPPATVTSALRAKLFDPTPNRVAAGQSELLVLQLNVTDSTGRSAPQNGDREVSIVSLNDPPTVALSVVPTSVFDTVEVLPFRAVIRDADPGDLQGNFTLTLEPITDPTFQYGTLAPASPSFTGNKAAVEAALQTVRFRPVPNQVLSQALEFRATVTDGEGASGSGTTTLTVVGVNDPPDLVAVPTRLIRLNDDQPERIFRTVRVEDPDQGGLQLVTVTVTPHDPSLGTLAPAGPFANLTPAEATAQLQAVVFTPAADQIPVGESVQTTFTLHVVDSQGASRTDSRTTVSILSVNGAPKVSVDGHPAAAEEGRELSPTPPVRPFAGYAITDDDTGNLRVTVTLDNRDKGALVNLGGFVEDPPASGVYRFTGTPTAATVALSALEFEVNGSFVFPPDRPGATRFMLQVEDTVLNRTSSALEITLREPPRNWLVTRVEDDLEEGSLRYALGQIEAHREHNSVITFALPEYGEAMLRLDPGLGPIVLGRNLTIKGPGADLLTISGDPDGSGEPQVQLFRVLATVTLEGLTLTQGRAETGGAIYVGETGRLTLRGCVLTASVAQRWGGAVDVDRGSLVMENCLVRGNRTDTDLGLGGGGVAVFTDLACRFVNTTFSANRQGSTDGHGGGALYVENQTPGTTLAVEVEHCTFAENDDAAGGGTAVHANVFGTLVRLRNVVLADARQRNLEVQGAGRIVSLGGNVSDDDTRVVLTQGGEPKSVLLLDQGTDRRRQTGILAAFQPTLRPVPGHPLAIGSPAINRAVAPAAGADQVGALRLAPADAGALEAGPRWRLAVNEIQFDPPAGGTAFVELYVLRDSQPVDLSGYQLLVNGTLRHVFDPGTVIQQGFGIMVADAVFAADGTPVVTPSASATLGLGVRGRLELRQPGAAGATVWAADYVGTFVDPFDPLDAGKFAHNSITLTPQFRGYAYLPHSLVLPPPLGGADLARDPTANTVSPGRDAGQTAFGSPNALPFAVADTVLVHEDAEAFLDVRANDLDADGSDQLFIVDLSVAPGEGGSDAQIASGRGAKVRIIPSGNPLRGTGVVYDPRGAGALQELPAGGKRSDSFRYTIQDFGTGTISAYSGTASVAPVTVRSPGHRLATGASIVIVGAGVAAYAGEHIVTRLDDDHFTIPVAFTGDPEERGTWQTRGPRQPSAPSEALVRVTVLGANDPPTPVADLVATDEETLIRIMADPDLAGSAAVFDTDTAYPAVPQIVTPHLLANDDDPDLDDDRTTLRVVGVVGVVNDITDYAGVPGESPVQVTSPGHGLTDGDVVLISGYGGHPSYNDFQVVTVLDEDTFSVPVRFVDNAVTKGGWAILTDANRLAATSRHGATVTLEIRADRAETSVVYNPRSSAYLNGLAVGETEDDVFYYAVQDSHFAVSLAPVTVRVAGVNDLPVPAPEPGSLALLEPVRAPGQSLAELVATLEVYYALPAGSGTPSRSDVRVQPPEAGPTTILLTGLWTTDEETDLLLAAADLLANDQDVDRSDVLRIRSVASPSAAGASVQRSADGQTLTYRPSVSARLQALARGEPFLDTFEVTITDDQLGDVPSLVAVLVRGVNDTPVARDDATTTDEDTALTLNPIRFPPEVTAQHDSDRDIDGSAPDNRLMLMPVAEAFSTRGARYTATADAFTYDPATSTFLNGLAVGQTAMDEVPYTVMDGSFVFANDDRFKVAADGAGYQLAVLANDRNLTGLAGDLEIASVGPASNGGVVLLDATRRTVLYTPEVNFVGDEVFPYVVVDPLGNADHGVVTVQVTVNALNGNLQANADAFTVARGESSVLEVLANDHTLPQLGSELFITRIVTPPARDVVTLTGNRLVYAQTATGPFPYTTTFRYEVSGGGTARAQAEVVVLVVNRHDTLELRADAFSVPAGSRANRLAVLANDNLLPGSTAGLFLREIAVPPARGTVEIAPDQQTLLYTPAGGFVGEDTLEYVATDRLGGTGRALVRLWVGSLTTANDFFAVPFDDASSADDNGVTELDVLANDRVLQGAPAVLRVLSVTPALVPLGAMSVKADGSVLVFDPAPDAVGEAEFTYVIGDASVPPRTATGRLTVVVVNDGVRANGDVFTVLVNSSANLLPVLANDTAVPDRGRPLTVVDVGVGAEGPNRGGTVVVAADHRALVYTPAPGFRGEETFSYLMTDSRRTDTARVVVRVSAGELAANDDAFTVFHDPDSARPPVAFTLPVLANDQVLPSFGQLLRITGVGMDDLNASNAPDRQGVVTISPDGATLRYLPRAANPPYTETFTYEVSDGTARRSQATVRIEVLKRTNARDLETNADAFSVEADSRNNVLPVLANDGVKPAPATGWVIADLTAPAFGGSVAVAGSTLLYSPVPGFVGTDEFSYTVWDGLGGTGTATVRVKVGDRPLSPDQFSALSGSTGNRFAVLANDGIRPASGASYQLAAAGGTDRGGSVQVVADEVEYAPDPAYAGSYPYREQFWYEVQDDSGLLFRATATVEVHELGSDRATASIRFTVQGVNDPPVLDISGASLFTITDKQTVPPFVGVVITEVDDQGQEALVVRVVVDDPEAGAFTSLGGFVETPAGSGLYQFTGTAAAATTALHGLVFVPTENYFIVPTTQPVTFTLTVEDPYISQPVAASLVVNVQTVNDPPVIAGTVAGQEVYYLGTIRPFASTTIIEVDDRTLQPLAVTVAFDASRGALVNPNGFVPQSPGQFRYNGTAAQATTALRGVVFAPQTANRLVVDLNPPPGTEETHFTLTVEDGFAPPVVDATTSVIAVHSLIRKGVAGDAASGDLLGFAVAASRDLIALGTPGQDDFGNDSGSVYVRARNQGGFEQWGTVTQLYASDPAANARFGHAVAMSGNLLAVGAPQARVGSTQSGTVYVFEPSAPGATDWQAGVVRLTPFDGANGDEFGYAVALSGDTLAVGARSDDDRGSNCGAVYVYRRVARGNWTLVTPKLVPADLAAGDQFGHAVGLHANTLVVGSPLDDDNGTDSGSAYLYERNLSGVWVQTKKLLPLLPGGGNDGAAGDRFGFAVATARDTVIIGSPQDDDGGSNRGSAYAYGRNTGGAGQWGQQAKLAPPDVLNNDEFGRAVATSGALTVVGMPFAGTSNQSRWGAAYAFGLDADGITWRLLEKLAVPDGINNDQFGWAVGLGDGTAVVGSPNSDAPANDSGSAYVYELRQNNPPAVGTPIPEQRAIVGVPFTFLLPPSAFGDPDTDDSLAFSVGPLPGWLTFNPATATFSGTPGAANLGPSTITVTARDRDGLEASTTFTVAVVSGTTLNGPGALALAYPDWIARYFSGRLLADERLAASAWGLDADPDGDGRNNLEEYAFASNPVTEDDALPVVLSRGGDGRLWVSYRRRTGDARLAFHVEVSADLQTWQSAAVVLGEPHAARIDAQSEWISAPVSSPEAETARFFRVRVTY